MDSNNRQPFLAFAVETLRSTDEKQSSGTLYDSSYGSYCALGVLLHTLGMTDDEMEQIVGINDDLYDTLVETFHSYGFSDVSRTEVVRIIDMNDDDEYSFTEIAEAFAGKQEEV